MKNHQEVRIKRKKKNDRQPTIKEEKALEKIATVDDKLESGRLKNFLKMIL